MKSVRLFDVLSELDRGRHKNGNGQPKQQPRIITFEGRIEKVYVQLILGYQYDINFALLEPARELLFSLFLKAPQYKGSNSKNYREREVLEFFRAAEAARRRGEPSGLSGVVNAAVENGYYLTSRSVRSFQLGQSTPPFKCIEAAFIKRHVDPGSYRSFAGAEQAGFIR